MELKKLKRCKKLKIEELLTALKGGFGFTEECLENGYYSGTLFWFPLRETISELSDNIYDKNKVLDLFRSFQTEAVDSLLFLKSVCQVELYCKYSATEMDLPDGQPFFTTELQDPNGKIKLERQSFLEKIKEVKGGIPSSDIISVTHLKFKTVRKTRGVVQAVIGVSEWIVVNMYKGGDLSDKLVKLIKDEDMGYIPYAGVAVPLNDTEKSFKGHIFCFLPLPQEKKSLTGLPVHVNGFFAVSKNRRHLKWASADQEDLGTHRDKAIEWNECLVSEVIPEIYFRFLREMIELSKEQGNSKESVEGVYRCFPDCSQVDTKWEAVAEGFFGRVKQMDCVFLSNRHLWVKPLEPTYTMFDNQPVDEQTKECVRKILDQYATVNTTVVPKHIWEFVMLFSTPKDISAAEVSRIIRTGMEYTEATKTEKLILLSYIMMKSDNSLLQGLELLPLENDSFTAFSQRKEAATELYVCTAKEMELFPGLEKLFVSTRLSTDMTSMLKTIAEQGR